ncbi:hypothetical protein H696_00314 [Fonticula alba]|uniref:PSP proline-rich domain-containing protein n=1 Tax=Fonticula alba TaxID=691883 RepID=A0A058ZEA5_FONAL|nr:hypothetical protein H696_00314 [Fonticula alba]KCV72735.1 hypothetical protein H696_00314 [Fonticula alba]|eukprot:XP_009492436.1 hypothetical protein H696_00314 [Fonticula alba]
MNVDGASKPLSASALKNRKKHERRRARLKIEAIEAAADAQLKSLALASEKEQQQQQQQPQTVAEESVSAEQPPQVETPLEVTVEYVPEELPTPDAVDPALSEMLEVMNRFKQLAEKSAGLHADDEEAPRISRFDEVGQDTREDEGDENDEDEENQISRKRLRRVRQLSVADLKRLVNQPDVVEWVDVTAADPTLLVTLKATKNAVPVPRHWAQKRKYLQNKRGLEKPAFELPKYIRDTGIVEMREDLREREANQSLSQKMRDRMRPKLDRNKLPYELLHAAFIVHQTRPPLTQHGDVYYEGKEFEVTMPKDIRPGYISPRLREALGMPLEPHDPSDISFPPPWLYAMQTHGPPPSYPSLKIPGVNAPLPERAKWGVLPGLWGQPPVDSMTRPLYGDIFGVLPTSRARPRFLPYTTRVWGEIEQDLQANFENQDEIVEGQDAEHDYIDADVFGDEAAPDAGGLETPAAPFDLRKSGTASTVRN